MGLERQQQQQPQPQQPEDGRLAATEKGDEEEEDEDARIEQDDRRPITVCAGHFDAAKPRLSARRWSILAGLCVFGLLSGMVNELTAILSTLTELLGLRLDHYVYIQQAFSYARPISALPCAWYSDRYGLRSTMYLALLLSVLRNSARALLFAPQTPLWAQLRFLYWSVAALAESLVSMLYYCLPLKASESWFPKEERSFAWSCVFVAPYVGASLASLLMPHYIEPATVWLLAEENLLALIVSSVAVVALVDRSRPEHPPSERQQLAELGLKRLAAANATAGAGFLAKLAGLLHFDTLMHLLVTCSFDAMIFSINSLSQDVLAGAGLSRVFCGNLLAGQWLSLSALQVFSSWRLDRSSADGPAETQQQQQQQQPKRRRHPRAARMKLYLACQWAAFMLLLVALAAGRRLVGQQRHWWLVVGAFQLYTVCACWVAPTCADLLMELVLGRLSDATIWAGRTGLYCLLQNLYQALFVYLRRPPASDATSDDGGGHHSGSDYSLSMLFVGLVLSSLTLTYLLCFSGPDEAAARRAPASRPPVGQTHAATTGQITIGDV